MSVRKLYKNLPKLYKTKTLYGKQGAKMTIFVRVYTEKHTNIHLLKLGNNPMVGATAQCAVVEEASK